MKKIVLISLTIFTLILTACGAATNSLQSGSTSTSGSLPVATQLILGVFKLDETDQAVTSEQASELLPLWQVYQGLLNSDTTAQEEVDALVEQLQGSMTAEQMKAIAEMNLSQQDVLEAMQTYSTGQESNTVNSVNNSSSQNGGFAPPNNGGMFTGAGAPPDGGMPELISGNQTQNTVQSTSEFSQSILASLLDPLIELLQNKAGL